MICRATRGLSLPLQSVVRGSTPAGLGFQQDSYDATSKTESLLSHHRLIPPLGFASSGGKRHTSDQGKHMQFRGRNRKDVKRKILTYWASHSSELGMSLREFLSNCRMGPNEQTIVFTVPQS